MLGPPLGRSQDSLAFLLSKKPCNEVSGRSESLFGRNHSGFGINQPPFGRRPLCLKFVDVLLCFG